ncbi:hypothetical protein FIU69_07160 [Streptococcus pneumoniae]|nr:hypothetical protein FIU69_07160 [Streptococcus pneumoniae]
MLLDFFISRTSCFKYLFYYTTLGLFSQLFFPKNRKKPHFLFLKDNFSYFDAKKGISFKFS